MEAGGLINYASNYPDLWRRAATYVDKILNTAKPAELPIEQPTKFDLIVNLQTAKALGITVRPTILVRADRSSNEPERRTTIRDHHKPPGSRALVQDDPVIE